MSMVAVLLRWVGALCLYLIVAALWVPTVVAQLVTGAGLTIIEPLKETADKLLRGRGR